MAPVPTLQHAVQHAAKPKTKNDLHWYETAARLRLRQGVLLLFVFSLVALAALVATQEAVGVDVNGPSALFC